MSTGATDARPSPTVVSASAPGKVILIGEHGVNRGADAIVAAVAPRVDCSIAPGGADGAWRLVSGVSDELVAADALDAFGRRVDEIRERDDHRAIAEVVHGDFLAPMRYLLALLVRERPSPGGTVTWTSPLPIGAGLGSGAAAGSALVVGFHGLADRPIRAEEVAQLAWQADVIAHGGTASALDSSGCALGGVVRYSVADGPRSVPACCDLRVVIADTGIHAPTATVNAGVRERLAARPGLEAHVFRDMDVLADAAAASVVAGDLPRLGSCMTLDQLLLERIGVSCPAIDALVEAALAAGAHGAKLSGSGGGGIVVALVDDATAADVEGAMRRAGGRAFTTRCGVPGARVDAAAPTRAG